MKKILLLIGLLLPMHPANAALSVFACEPEWGDLVRQIGGDKVDVYVATTGKQDPHQIQARPSLIARARGADLVVCTGAELEVGWLPLVLRQSANPRVQPGTPGYFEAASRVRLLEIPSRLDRADGDVHASGNPHFQTDPRNILPVADGLAEKMAALDPASAEYYRARHKAFAEKFGAAIANWQARATGLRGTAIVVGHKNWVYLREWLGLTEIASLEPKPGVPPSSGHLAHVLDVARSAGARLVVFAAYEDPQPARWLSDHAGIPAVELPFTVGGTDRAVDLFSLYEDTVDRLLQAAKP